MEFPVNDTSADVSPAILVTRPKLANDPASANVSPVKSNPLKVAEAYGTPMSAAT
jgi:hypothetical protein